MGVFDWCGPGRSSEQHQTCPGRYPANHQLGIKGGTCGCACHTRPATLAGESINNRK